MFGKSKQKRRHMPPVEEAASQKANNAAQTDHQATFPHQAGVDEGETYPKTSGSRFTEMRQEPTMIHPHEESALPDTANSELGGRLLFAARAIENHNRDLSRHLGQLGKAIGARLAGEARLVGQGIRLAIGLIWILVALALILAPSISGNGGTGLSAIPVVDAQGLSRIFLIAGIPACLLALIAGVYVHQSSGSSRIVRQAAGNLGLHAASITQDFDVRLSQLLTDTHGEQDPGRATESLSMAHITALEAQLYFRRLKFLHTESRMEALSDLKQAIRGHGVGSVPAPLVFVMGLLSGFIAAKIATTSGSAVPAGGGAPLPDIFRYPGFLLTLLTGGIFYVFAGMLANLFLPLFGNVRRQAMEDSLDSVRSAYIADNAPRLDEVIRRVEESMGAFQARLEALQANSKRYGNTGGPHQGLSNPSSLTPLQQPSESHQPTEQLKDKDLPWRCRDSSARFVDTGFQAAPNPYRRDADPSKLVSKNRKK